MDGVRGLAGELHGQSVRGPAPASWRWNITRGGGWFNLGWAQCGSLDALFYSNGPDKLVREWSLRTEKNQKPRAELYRKA